ncbi:MAG: hypothetical protein IJB81_03875 [Clostridia bacterium]|nr:hypothetical protein [Clostridia bacterium]
MKKLMVIALALLLAVSGMASAEPARRTGKELSYARIVDMAQCMQQLVMGDYLSLKQVPEEQQRLVRGWAAGIGDTPRLVVQLELEDSMEMKLMQAYFRLDPAVIGMEAQCTVALELYWTMLYSASAESGVTGASYDDVMQINSSLGAFSMYAEEGPEGMSMYLVLYDNAAPILLLVNSENGAVGIQGMFLPSQKLAQCEHYGDVAMWLMLSGVAMGCEEIKAE